MHSSNKKIIISICILTIISLSIYFFKSKSKKDQTWEAIILGIPDKITPEIAPINMGYYILKQTHEPLFFWDDTINQYRSNVLKRWTASIDFRSFTFCLDERKLFDNGKKFSFNLFVSFAKNVIEKFNKDYKLDIANNNCVKINFKESQNNFLQFLSYYENSPSIPTDNPKIHLGLGAYKVVEFDEKSLTLTRKNPIRNGFNKIVFINYKGAKDPNLENKNIEDFNRIYIEDLPEWIKKEYANYPIMLFQTINLLINNHDKRIREYLYNCLNIEELRKAFMPKQNNFQDISNILPIGMVGASPQKPQQHCEKIIKLNKSIELKFINWKEGTKDFFTNYFDLFYKKHNIRIKVEQITLNDLLKLAFNKPHPYDLAIVALDTVRPDYSAFYGYLIGEKNNLIDVDIPITDDLKELMLEEDSIKIVSLVKKINRKIHDSITILPLYQEVRDFYYPKNIKHLNLGRNFLEYPDVADLRL